MFLVGVFWGIHRGRGPPCVLHFKNFRNGEYKMSKCIKIRIKDFYKDAVGETEYTYVTEEVYEALVNTFRKETHAEEMRDLRAHNSKWLCGGNDRGFNQGNRNLSGGYDNQAD